MSSWSRVLSEGLCFCWLTGVSIAILEQPVIEKGKLGPSVVRASARVVRVPSGPALKTASFNRVPGECELPRTSVLLLRGVISFDENSAWALVSVVNPSELPTDTFKFGYFLRCAAQMR